MSDVQQFRVPGYCDAAYGYCPTPAPTTSPCIDYDAEVRASSAGLNCATLASMGYCASIFCPTCSTSGYCDAACGYCSEDPGSENQPSVSPTISLVPTTTLQDHLLAPCSTAAPPHDDGVVGRICLYAIYGKSNHAHLATPARSTARAARSALARPWWTSRRPVELGARNSALIRGGNPTVYVFVVVASRLVSGATKPGLAAFRKGNPGGAALQKPPWIWPTAWSNQAARKKPPWPGSPVVRLCGLSWV